MQTQTVSAFEARNRLGELLDLVYYQKQEIIIKKMNKIVAKIVPSEVSVLDMRVPTQSIVQKYYGFIKSKKPHTISDYERIAKSGFTHDL